MKILALSGSLREKSTNTSLLRVAQGLSPKETEVLLYDGLGELPPFNPDLDDHPASSVSRFREAIAAADALLFSTPEYAHGIPGALKNALDWLVSDPRFYGKPVGVLFGSASDSRFAQEAFLEVLKTMSARIVPGAVLSILGVKARFNAAGALSDATLERDIRDVVCKLAEFYAASTGRFL